MSSTVEISVISPVYQAVNIIDTLVGKLEEVMSDKNYEIILIDDGSSDNGWLNIVAHMQRNGRIKGIKLSRNFGQHAAVSAGVEYCVGQTIVVMDCDMQDHPQDIPKLIEAQQQGFDIVFTKRINRQHSFFKNTTAAIYNWLFRLISNKNFDVNQGSLVLFNRKVANEFNRLKDADRLYIQLLKWTGFKSTYVPVEHHKRQEGNSTYSLSKLFRIAIEGLTSHSDKLLRLTVASGFILSACSFIGIAVIVFLYLLYGFQAGWPSIMVTILFSTGLVLTSIGIAGIYIGKIFNQVKDRPLYVVEEKINFDSDNKP